MNKQLHRPLKAKTPMDAEQRQTGNNNVKIIFILIKKQV
jgi:hypothetical protein